VWFVWITMLLLVMLLEISTRNMSQFEYVAAGFLFKNRT